MNTEHVDLVLGKKEKPFKGLDGYIRGTVPNTGTQRLTIEALDGIMRALNTPPPNQPRNADGAYILNDQQVADLAENGQIQFYSDGRLVHFFSEAGRRRFLGMFGEHNE